MTSDYADRSMDLLSPILGALGVELPSNVRVVGAGSLASTFRVTDLAVASIAAAGICLDSLMNHDDHGRLGKITVDRGLASHWFKATLRPRGWDVPPVWDPIAGDYEASDGWIRLHTNARRHRTAARRALGVRDDPRDVVDAVRRWTVNDLEQAVVDAGGAAAAMHSIDEWRRHAQGTSVRTEPVVSHELSGLAAPPLDLRGVRPRRPLAGVRVLDLTRVLAGPVATRLLAGWGAEVLRIDPPDWDEPGVVPEIMLGKKTARLDLTIDTDRERFTELLSTADLLVHGYRTDALDRLGFGQRVRDNIRPGLIDVALNAYGWTGPWSGRRGFDSLVQMSSGIADEGMRAYGRRRPTPLPVQAIDHATGYLLAASALRAIARYRETRQGSRWRVSLARTAQLLIDSGRQDVNDPATLGEPALSDGIEDTTWGPAQRLVPPLTVKDAPLHWDRPARAIGADAASW
jgi:CoA transferase family III